MQYWDVMLHPLGQLLSRKVHETKFRLFPYDMPRHAGGPQEGKLILYNNNIFGSHRLLYSQPSLDTSGNSAGYDAKNAPSRWSDTVWKTDGQQFTQYGNTDIQY